MPSAPPSTGSVPAPSSSSSTSAGISSVRSIAAMLVTCHENVLRLASIDCSSPMSAKIVRKTGSAEPASAGMCRPHCAISARSAAVLSATVLPPVFGPVMTSTRVGGISLTSTATGSRSRATRVPPSSRVRETTAGISSGWRAPVSSRRPSVDSPGALARQAAARRALAWTTSSAVAASMVCASSSPRSRKALVNAVRIRKTSAFSSSFSAISSLLISTVASGSR